jgi:hypothetical protein
MILAVHTDASYLSKQSGKSRTSAHFYLMNHNDKEFNNGAILTLSSIIKHIMSSVSEAELAALYYGCKLAVPICTTLEEIGHPQTKCTMVTTNNITAQGLTMGIMTPKHPNQWINASIGSNAAMPNVSFFISGVPALTIAQTTPTNIILQNITKQSVRFTFRTLPQVNEHPLQLHLTPTFHSS